MECELSVYLLSGCLVMTTKVGSSRRTAKEPTYRFGCRGGPLRCDGGGIPVARLL